jgi:hypothetical protein
MRRAILRSCHEADRDHARDPRAFAHVGHHAGAVCLAHGIVFLPRGFILGILLHELGHLALLPGDHSEAEADQAGGRLAGVRIRRRTHGRALDLEYVSAMDEPRALRALRRLTNY